MRSVVSLPFEGFSENRNAFAFQLLLAVCAVCAAGWRKSEFWLGLIFGGLLLSGSRANLLALALVLGFAFYRGVATARQIFIATTLAAAVYCFVDLGPDVIGYLGSLLSGKTFVAPQDISTLSISASDDMRMVSLIGGWKLFSAHPIFGAGLGAFIHQEVLAGNALIIHSTPLWLLAEMGLTGLVILSVPIVRIFIMEIAKSEQRDTAGILLLLIIAAFGVVSNAHEILYQRAFWLLLGAALAFVPDRAKGNQPGLLPPAG